MYKLECERRCPFTCYKVSFSPNGKLLAVSGYSKERGHVWIIDIFSGKHFALNEHMGIIYDLIWLPNSHFLITCSSDWTIMIWDLRERERVCTIQETSYVYCLCPLGENSFISGNADGIIKLYNFDLKLKKTKLIFSERHNGSIQSLDVYGKLLASGDQHGVVKVWDIKDNEFFLRSQIEHEEIIGDVITNVKFFPVPGRKTPVVIVCVQDNSLYVLEISGYQPTRRLTGIFCRDYYLDMCLCLDKEHIITGSENGRLNIYHIRTNELVGEIHAHASIAQSVASNPKLNIIASCGFEDQMVRIWFPENDDFSGFGLGLKDTRI